MDEKRADREEQTSVSVKETEDEVLELRRKQKRKRVYDLLEQTPLSRQWQRIFDKYYAEGVKMAKEEGSSSAILGDVYGEGYARGFVHSRKASVLRMMLAQEQLLVLLSLGDPDEKMIRAMASQYRIPLDEKGNWSASPRRVLVNQLQQLQKKLERMDRDADYFASEWKAMLEQQKLRRKELMAVCRRMEAMLLLQCTDEEYDHGDNGEVVAYAED